MVNGVALFCQVMAAISSMLLSDDVNPSDNSYDRNVIVSRCVSNWSIIGSIKKDY